MYTHPHPPPTITFDIVSERRGIAILLIKKKNCDLGVAVRRICRMKSPAEFTIRRLIDGMGYR